jgi:hypothetical protein
MINVYDRIVEPYETSIKRYGIEYTLEKRTRMGNQLFYTFTAPGEEKLLIIPYFAEQYKQAEKIYRKISRFRKLDTCINHLKRELNRRVIAEEIINSDSKTGYSTLLTVDYMDIRLTFEFIDEKLIMAEEFEIISNNIFGNGIIVSMNINTEDN